MSFGTTADDVGVTLNGCFIRIARSVCSSWASCYPTS